MWHYSLSTESKDHIILYVSLRHHGINDGISYDTTSFLLPNLQINSLREEFLFLNPGKTDDCSAYSETHLHENHFSILIKISYHVQ